MAKMPRHKCWSDQTACIQLDIQRAPPVTCSTYQCHYSRPYVPGNTWKCYYTEQKKQEFQQWKERLIDQVSRYAMPDTLCLRDHLEQQERGLPGLCCCGSRRCSSKLTNELCCSRRWGNCAQSGMCVYTRKPCCWAEKGCCWKNKNCFCNQWKASDDKKFVNYNELERGRGELGRSCNELGWSYEDQGRRCGYQWQPCGDGWHRANYENTQCPSEFALLPWPQQKMALADVYDSSLSTKSIPQCAHLPCPNTKTQPKVGSTSCSNTGKGFGTMYISGKKML